MLAEKRDHSGPGWFLIACVRSPLLAYLLLLVTSPKTSPFGFGVKKVERRKNALGFGLHGAWSYLTKTATLDHQFGSGGASGG
jgi:hypothetical protein